MGEWHVTPPSSGFALPARQPTELAFDSSSGDSVRDQNEHSHFCIPSQDYLCGCCNLLFIICIYFFQIKMYFTF